MNRRTKQQLQKMIEFNGGKPILLSVIIGVLLIANIFTFYLYRKEAGDKFLLGLCEEKYSFINPRFGCGDKHVIDKKGYAELKSELISLIEQKKNEGKVEQVAIFFRDLESGPTLGINDRIDFVPASLLKLPYALAALRLAEEEGPEILQEKVTYTGNPIYSQVFKPKEIIRTGTAYTVDELIFRSLAYSDNLAGELLFDYLKKIRGDDLILGIYRDLGIINPEDPITSSIISTKGYASIFRQLYNVSFLNRDSSEKLLSILSQSNFENGLAGGVPRDLKIAHKFGERFLETGEKQLHDCGIIYYPGNPYLLCVMTRGNNFNDLANIIGVISEEFYKEMDSRRL
ncbi:MAG: serine hydrolase [Candidatus Taylorbacteria bacterium]|nr:serine hydrolase [Candidatus Taylorbacteria bacterium]